MSRVRWLVLGVVWALARGALAQTSTSNDAKVQPPQVKAPERASLVGQLASTAFGPADLTRGAFSLPAPLSVPTERGPLLASPFPSYAADAGMGEWGAGWQARVSITRMRVQGDPDFLALAVTADELDSPFGRLRRGADGSWYPLGLSGRVRVKEQGDTLVAYLPDGTRMSFGGAVRVTSSTRTYAWYLTEALSVTGRKTRFEWTANASGRPFVSKVWYGGVGEDFQHRIDVEHEALPLPFEDYRAGQLLALDRRVKKVTALAKNASTGAFEERWRFELGYAGDAFGPAFHLTSVQQVFRSGARPPPVTYAYHTSQERLAATRLVPAPKLDAVLAVAADVVQPNRSSVLDDDDDGMPDLEWAQDNRLLRQTDTGFATVPIQAARGAFAGCLRPAAATNVPRTMSRLRSGAGDDATYVVSLGWDGNGTTTLRACTREGTIVGSTTMRQNWTLGPTVRLADLNRDNRPDLVSVSYGQYRILPNTSTRTSFSFGAGISGTLSPAIMPDTAWVHDFNGDGIPDLVVRYSGGLVVWYGKGSFGFAPQGRVFPLRTLSGGMLTSLTSYALTFVDANKDGLTDVLLAATPGNTTILFMNRGTYFQAVSVPGLAAVTSSMSQPVVLDAQGGGNTAVTFTQARKGYTVELDGPETGLMAWADDGRGTVLSFEYGRSAPSPGGRHRQAVLDRLSVDSSGQAPVSYSYAYGAPHLHSVGHFLIGYGQVQRTAPLEIQKSDFLHDDTVSGLLLSSTTADALVTGVEQFSRNSYEDATYQGIPWKRQVDAVSGWRATDGSGASVSERTRTTAWWSDVCPAQTVKDTRAGTLTTDTQYVTPAAFTGHLACLTWDVVEVGTHADGRLNFTHETAISRNDVGLVTRVQSVSGTEAWTLQENTYTSDWLVETVSAPGHGTTTVTYDPATRLVRRVVSPVGVAAEVVTRDPLTSALELLRTTRGALVHEQHFEFDGQERVASVWDNIGSGSRLNPDLAYAYAFATASTPGAVTTSLLVDSDTMSVREQVDLLTAAGKPVVTGTRIPEGWSLGALTWRNPAAGLTAGHRRAALGSASLVGLAYTDLFSGADEVERTTSGPFGVAAAHTLALHADVHQSVVESLGLDATAAAVVRNARENGTYDRTSARDAAGQVIAAWDEAGTAWQYGRDALGRLREVRLPDGTAHRLGFDGHGRVSRVEREGIATIESVFDPATGLVQEKRFLSPAGIVRRRITYVHDAAGRVTRELHADPATGATKVFRYFHDGATPENPSGSHAAGLLSAVVGDGYVKRLEYRVDGKLARRTTEIGSWRRVVTDLAYNEAGEPRGQSVFVTSGQTTIASTARLDQYDSHGRITTSTLGGAVMSTRVYDADGRLASVSFANRDALALEYDDFTRRQVGSAQTTPQYVASTSRRMSPRALPELDAIRVGSLSLTRQYGHSSQRFLTSASDAQKRYRYAFDPSGLPIQIVENDVITDLVTSGSTLTAGPEISGFDNVGRTVQRGDLRLAYGPDGQLASATRGARTWTFVHDEAGQRLAKLEGGTPVAAYLPEGYLDATGLVEPVVIGGRTVGVIRSGVFETVATDLLGTVLADADGTPRVASPFGHRDAHPDRSAAIDYVEKGFDADLGLVRMGVRDYDPAINRFTTPDPLFLEEPAKCVDSPAECNLYGYARNDPAGLRDPSGTMADIVVDAALIGYDVGSGIAHAIAGDWKALKVDAVALAADVVCAVVPFATGGGPAVRAAAAAEKAGVKLFYAGEKRLTQTLMKEEQLAGKGAAHGNFDAARREAFEKAGMTSPEDVRFSRMDPKTGTVVEFKGPGGAKVGYDGPHDSPGPFHDRQHISIQTAGKREGGGRQRENIPYSGPQHPSRTRETAD